MATQVAQLIDVQTTQGQEILNVYHFVDTSGVLTLDTLAAAYIADVIPQAQAWQTTTLSHIEVRGRIVAPTAGLVQSFVSGLPLAGSHSTTEEEPTFVSASVKYVIGSTVVLSGGFTGHIKRGGTRLCGLREDQVVTNALSAGTVTSIHTQCSHLQAPSGGGWVLCVASYLNGARVRQPTVQSYATVTGFSDGAPSTENLRKVLRGRAS